MNPVIWQYIGIFSTILAVVLLAALVWRRRELRRYEAMELADKFAEWGLDPVVRLLRAYAVGNYIGKDSIGRVIRELIADLKSGGLESMLRRIAWKIIKNVFLENADDRAQLTKLLTPPPVTPTK